MLKDELAPPPTEPSPTRKLWHDVWTSVSIAKRQRTMPPSRRAGKSAAYASPPASTADSSVDPGESASRSAGSTVTLRSRGFEDAILVPRRIVVLSRRGRAVLRAHQHFGLPILNHNQLPDELRHARVWVDPDSARDIADEYFALNQESYNEDEFAQLALEMLLHNESRADKERGERKPRAERLLKPTCKPSGDGLWDVPPIFDSDHSARYNWDVRADATYCIQKRSFNPDYMPFIESTVHMGRHGSVTCPYLTIEFKRSDEDDVQAQRQALAAGSMALYNRYCLHARARNENREQASSLAHIRHYAMTACGHMMTVYVIQPVERREDELHAGDAVDSWGGCNMELLMALNMRQEAAVKFTIEWVNAIHFWGLTSHLRSCENDIKILLQQIMEVDTSGLVDLSVG
ncbi:hypothetical protein Tdes44962_MAKER07950 [Teratosphaeria destructans]|uniref:Uncharacterized protein n=1 Tax=Teratosphaeria destructans TaxID=418781 RepID=A0A9W7SXW3_9PEZI|nr:hypothetical protein Tdes44962_MAKER07950 [Teratosphaeria destructans]